MIRSDDRINRRAALLQLSAATMLVAGAAPAQRPDPSAVQIKSTALGHKTYMLEGQGGNVLVVVGDDGIIMVDAELAPLHDKLRAAITESSSLPVKYLVDTHFHGEQTGGNAPFHRDGAIIVAQDNVRVRLLAGTTNGLNYNNTPPAQADAIPTETYVGCTKTVAVRGREACSPMPPTRIPTETAGFILRTPTSSSRVISSTITAATRRSTTPMAATFAEWSARNEDFLRLTTAETKVASSRGSAVAGEEEAVAARPLPISTPNGPAASTTRSISSGWPTTRSNDRDRGDWRGRAACLPGHDRVDETSAAQQNAWMPVMARPRIRA